MGRHLLLCIIALYFIGPVARANTDAFPSGFIDSVAVDPASGLSVHVKIKNKPGLPWLVLIHGMGQQASKDWLPVLPVLADHYQLLLFDLPGFGDSGRPDTALTPKKYADLVHWLVTQYAQAPVNVAGHSLGGAIALRYSHDYPDDVQRLLLIDAAGILQTVVFARHLTQVPAHIGGLAFLDPFTSKGSRLINHFSGKAQDLVADNSAAIQTLAGSDLARQLLYEENSNLNAALGLVNEDFSPLIHNLKTPVWMLWEERDPVAPLRTGLALKWLLPQAQLEILDGASHVPMKDDTGSTGAWFLRSLNDPPPPPAQVAGSESHGDGMCKDQNNLVFRGKWRSLRLEHCANIRIENATLEQLIVLRSNVSMLDVTINAAKEIAIEARNANITATGLQINAPQAWDVEASRMDLAAFYLETRRLGQQKGRTDFFLSLGRWCDGSKEWRMHGVWKPRAGNLDPQFQKTDDGDCTARPAGIGR